MDLKQLAQQLATDAHAGQFRRDGVTPYIKHPEAVVARLQGERSDVIAAAWLHDVIEDPAIPAVDLLRAGIPRAVVDAVVCLTKSNGQLYSDYLIAVKSNQIARKVKIADMLANLADDPTRNQIIKYAKGLLVLV